MVPKASQAFCTADSMSGPSALMSSSIATARGVAAANRLRLETPESGSRLISLHRDASRSIHRAAAMIRQPALARSRQNCKPMPDEAPVTIRSITTLPSKLLHGSSGIDTWPAIGFLSFSYPSFQSYLSKAHLRFGGW
ncbi:hypothetical protein U1Q18_013784 [Sarracenia purpurea var. burkii]